MILDANTGAVLHNDDGDELRHPASLTKMMTLYLTFEIIESGRLSMSDSIKISQEAASAAPSNLDLEPGEEITVANAIKALITKSANDVAVALSEKIGGSQANFVRLMNARARDLGMSKTHFENASGLPNDDQVTTARDMITLGLHLQDDFPSYYPLFATRAFTYNGSTHRNHNTLLNTFQGIDGIKTGYTRASGFNLVSSVSRGGRHLVGAVFGGDSASSRNGEMRNLLTRGLTRASAVKTRKPAPALIARLKSAPKIAERPALKAKPAVKIAEAAVPRVQPTATLTPPAPIAVQPAPEQPAPAQIAPTEPLPAQAAATPLEVFKVRRVMVAPRQGPKRPPASADETTDMAPEEAAADTTAPSAEAAQEAPMDAIAQNLAASEAADASDQGRETIVPKLVAAAVQSPPAAAYDAPMALLGAADTNPAVTAPEAETPPAVVPVAAAVQIKPKTIQKPQAAASAQRLPVQRGLMPSSLQAQAASLGPQPHRVAALMPASAGATGSPPRAIQGSGQGAGRYEIQIGAYSSIDEAQRMLTSVQARASKLLAGYGSVTHPVQKEGRQVFRARFSGFDAQRAANTCTELRRQAVECFVMTAE